MGNNNSDALLKTQKGLTPTIRASILWSRVKEWTRAACQSMIELAVRLFPKWLKANAPALSLGRDLDGIWKHASAEVLRKVMPRRRNFTQSRITEMIMERVRALDWEAEGKIRERFIATR